MATAENTDKGADESLAASQQTEARQQNWWQSRLPRWRQWKGQQEVSTAENTDKGADESLAASQQTEARQQNWWQSRLPRWRQAKSPQEVSATEAAETGANESEPASQETEPRQQQSWWESRLPRWTQTKSPQDASVTESAKMGANESLPVSREPEPREQQSWWESRLPHWRWERGPQDASVPEAAETGANESPAAPPATEPVPQSWLQSWLPRWRRGEGPQEASETEGNSPLSKQAAKAAMKYRMPKEVTTAIERPSNLDTQSTGGRCVLSCACTPLSLDPKNPASNCWGQVRMLVMQRRCAGSMLSLSISQAGKFLSCHGQHVSVSARVLLPAVLDTQQFSTQSTFYERDSFEEEERHNINKIPVTASPFAKPINVPLGPKQRTDSAQSMNKAATSATSTYPGAASPQGTDTPPSDHTAMNSEIVAEQQGGSDVTPPGIPVGRAAPPPHLLCCISSQGKINSRQRRDGPCFSSRPWGHKCQAVGYIVLDPHPLHHRKSIALDPWKTSVKGLCVMQAPHLGP